MQKIEQRTLSSVELRAEPDFVIAGYGALFNSPSKNLGGFVETIAPTAFTRSLAEKAPVQFTFNHSQDFILARNNSNGTLALSTDAKGLKFRAQLNSKIQSHCDIWEACRSGLYTECSFAFTVAENGQSWSPDGTQRTLLDVDLIDVSLVGSPAYEGTTASARSADGGYVETMRARLATMNADFERSERAHALRMQLLSEGRSDSDSDLDEEDLFESACRELDPPLDFCDSDDDFVFASDPNDLNEENCLRFEYTVNADGTLEVDTASRTEVKHSLIHSERGRKILFFKRMKRTAGRG